MTLAPETQTGRFVLSRMRIKQDVKYFANEVSHIFTL